MAADRKAASKARKKAPWKRPNPKSAGTRKKMSERQKSEARDRARKAGRPYPNLVDNMAVSRKSAR